MEKEENNSNPASETPALEPKPPEQFVEFKKPIYIGKIPKKLKSATKTSTNDESARSQESISQNKEHKKAQGNIVKVPYKEPKWSGLPPPDSGYKFEVLKSGMILESIDLTTKPFHVFGRHVVDIVMAHPTISRCHAVIQYKAQETSGDDHPVGWYIYDLSSSHGTFLNKNRIKPNHYVRVKVGHLIKLGCSTRQFILQGPEEDIEEETELGLTEIKEQKMIKRLEYEREMQLAKHMEEGNKKKQEDNGISWGMRDDAEEETDLADNPFATTNNEELYLEDPKKTLRGYFEREGVPLEYHCEEKGIGQFLCRVELPIEDMSGRPIIAEVIHKGKKKDAVVQCALEACRVIDRHGLLRQAKHESRKRKEKDWQEIDFYDSDEDTFLDRTGAVEKKRKERIKKYKGEKEDRSSVQSNKAFTYDELVESCSSIQKNIDELNERLEVLRNQGKKEQAVEGDEDELDKFMKVLSKQSIADKAEISKTKMEIQNLKQELVKMQRLADIAKPMEIPALIKACDVPETSKGPIIKKTSRSVIIGKRIKLKNRVQTPYKQPAETEILKKSESEEENDSDDEISDKKAVLNCSGIERLGEISVDVSNEEQSNTSEKSTNYDKKPSEESDVQEMEIKQANDNEKKLYGPMRPPEGYVIPENYFDQENNRDLPEITDESEY